MLSSPHTPTSPFSSRFSHLAEPLIPQAHSPSRSRQTLHDPATPDNAFILPKAALSQSPLSYSMAVSTREEEGRPVKLTPKSIARLKLQCKAAADAVDPQPDWTLDDLKQELDALTEKFNVPTLPEEHSLFNNASYVSWRELSVPADFGRNSGCFRLCLSESDSEDSDDDLENHFEFREQNDVLESKDSNDKQSVEKTRSFIEVPGPRQILEEGHLLGKTGIVEGSLFELERERLLRVQEEIRQRQLSLEVAIEEETYRSAAILEQVEKDMELKWEMARRTDKQYQRTIAEARDLHLSALQRDHEQRSQVEARRIRREAAAEEARKREIAAREEKERLEKARAEAEAKKRDEALSAEKAAIEAEKRKRAEAAAEAASQRAEAERKAKQKTEQTSRETTATKLERITVPPSAVKAVSAGPKPWIAESAARLEAERGQKMKALLDVCYDLQSNLALKKELKSCERGIIKLLQQISATQQQVGAKSMELVVLLRNPSMHLPFVMTTFASKLMSQCESQVLKLPSYAFALAQVTINASSQLPELLDVVLAKLHEVCIFTVPKYYTFKKNQFETDNAYYKALGYNEEGGKLESTDDYIARMKAYMTFYAAITQTEVHGGFNPHGLKEGWSWCARLLNSVPADRLTASALEAFLKVAGFRLYQVYSKAFMKLMKAIVFQFIESLKAQNDPELRSVVNRLETYLHKQQFTQEPEGHNMRPTDLSSSLKAR